MDNDTAKKLSEQVASDMLVKFASSDFQTLIKAMQDVTDTGSFEIVISTDNVDRHGEIVSQKGIDFANYMTNPVVLWGHNHNQIPVGVTDEIYTRTVGTTTQTVAKGRFAPHEFAQTLRQLYDMKMLNTSSIGFIPKEYNGNTITKSELLEWSFVSIPANPYALALGKSGFDVADLIAKGFLNEEVKHGDDIVTDEPIEDKGAIADKVAEEDMYMLKQQKMEVIRKYFWAFCDVYFDEETPVEDFDTLLAEFITLLQGQPVEGTRLTVERDFDAIIAKHVAQKQARVLSAANREKITSAISALEEVLAADDGSTESTEAKGADGVQGKAQNEVEAVEDFLKLRKSVQQFAGVLTDVLKDSKNAAAKYVDVR